MVALPIVTGLPYEDARNRRRWMVIAEVTPRARKLLPSKHAIARRPAGAPPRPLPHEFGSSTPVRCAGSAVAGNSTVWPTAAAVAETNAARAAETTRRGTRSMSPAAAAAANPHRDRRRE